VIDVGQSEGGRKVSTDQGESIYRPKSPIIPKSGNPAGARLLQVSGTYLVTRRTELVAVYHPAYYRSVGEVVIDFIDLCRSDSGWEDRRLDHCDFVVWGNAYQGRVLAAMRWNPDTQNQETTLFPEDARDLMEPWPGWPTREEWIASGRGDLWWTEERGEE
jgi:hypothetical protein